MNLQSKPERAIDLLRGWPSPSLLPTASILSVTTKALSTASISTPGLLYSPDWGYEPLLSALASYLTAFYRPREPIGAGRLCVTGGASQNLACVLQAYTDPAYTRNVWMVAPTYFLACRIFRDAGFEGRLRSVREDEEGCDIGALRSGLREAEERAAREGNVLPELKPARPWNKRYRHIIYAVPTFANPSSRTMSLRRREELVRVAREFDALVVTDDVYDELQWHADAEPTGTTAPLDRAPQPRIVDVDRFLDGGPEREGADGFGNAVSNASFSKIVAPGWRTGWAEGTEKMAYGLSQVGPARSGGAPSGMTAAVACQLIESGELRGHISRVLQPAYGRRWRLLTAAIERHLVPLGVGAGRTTATTTARARVAGGYFVWISLPAPLRAEEVAARAEREERLTIAPGRLFGVDGEAQEELEQVLDRSVRISFSWEDEELLEEGVRRLARTVRRQLADQGTMT